MKIPSDLQASEHPGYRRFLAQLKKADETVDLAIAWQWFKLGWSAQEQETESRTVRSVLSSD